MKQIDNIGRKKSKPKQLQQKKYTPAKTSIENHEAEITQVEAGLEAAIEKLNEDAPQQGSGDGQQQGSAQDDSQSDEYSQAHIQQLEEEIFETKQVRLSADNSSLESILPHFILPSQLKKLYEQEALVEIK